MRQIGLLMSVLLLAGKSWACVCGSPPPLTKAILDQYSYVALVKVKTMDDFLIPVPVTSRKRPRHEGQFTIDVIKNFGKSLPGTSLPDTFILESYRTSCDIGLRPGQTWVIFAKVHNGRATVFACDYSIRYGGEQPVSDYEHLQRQSAEELLNSVRQLTGKPIQAVNGRIEKFYANSQRALLTEYRSDGGAKRTAWFANGRLRGTEFFRNGLKHGPATWWNANGTPRSTETFLAGIAVDTSRHWYNTDTDTLWLQSTRSLSEQARDSMLQTNKRSHIQSITVADRQGRLLSSRQYDWYGRLVDETIGVPETGVEWRTAYDKQGNVNFLIVTRAVPSPDHEPTQQLVYRIDYDKDGSRQVAYYDGKGRLTRRVRVNNGKETVLEEKHYPD